MQLNMEKVTTRAYEGFQVAKNNLTSGATFAREFLEASSGNISEVSKRISEYIHNSEEDYFFNASFLLGLGSVYYNIEPVTLGVLSLAMITRCAEYEPSEYIHYNDIDLASIGSEAESTALFSLREKYPELVDVSDEDLIEAHIDEYEKFRIQSYYTLKDNAVAAVLLAEPEKISGKTIHDLACLNTFAVGLLAGIGQGVLGFRASLMNATLSLVLASTLATRTFHYLKNDEQ